MKKFVSFSGGKDSTAMLIRLLELEEQIDGIYFADTGFEFPELYEYIKKIEKYTGQEIKIIKPKNSFSHWFYGKVTRGNFKGKVRGFPMYVNPCFWAREAKIKPLQKLRKKADIFYIGIAFNEIERMSKDENIRYPLIEWKWTEQDCINYLNKKGLFNPLYANFNRLGCYFCPKQSISSLYVLWKNYPELWNKMQFWEKENIKYCNRTIKEKPLSNYEKDFKQGKKPKNQSKYECWNGCEGVKYAFKERQTKLKFC